MSVVFPDPFGPTMAVWTPSSIVRLTWSRMFRPPRRTVASSMARRGVLLWSFIPSDGTRWLDGPPSMTRLQEGRDAEGDVADVGVGSVRSCRLVLIGDSKG